jgi:hypothetical protein
LPSFSIVYLNSWFPYPPFVIAVSVISSPKRTISLFLAISTEELACPFTELMILPG